VAVIGGEIAFSGVDVAGAAVLGDGDARLVERRGLDAVRGVAVGADRGGGDLVLEHALAVDRLRVIRALLRLALSADVPGVHPPLRALLAAPRVQPGR